MKINKKIAIPALIVLSFALVAAGVVNYYFQQHVTVDIIQHITVEGELSLNIDCEAGETCYGSAVTIYNDDDEDRIVKIVNDNENENIDIDYVGNLDLSKKNISTWEITGEPTELIYSIVGEEFEYSSNLPENYTLIYYKDAVVELDGRLDNPQPVIEIVSDIGNLPQEDDANLYADYSEAPDYYEHSTGAKLWAVPSNAINEDKTLDWSQMNEFLYETDLIRYFANDVREISVPSGSFITFYPAVTIDNYVSTSSAEFNIEIQ